jgi:hypothetical protein
VQVALGVDVQVDQAVAGDLVQHVVEEGHAGIQLLLAGAIQVDRNADLRLVGIADDFGGSRCRHGRGWTGFYRW